MATILCIDDQADHLAIRRLLLATEGYTVLTATDGPTGVTLAQANAIDAVVLDYSMPVMDGEQVACILRQEHPALKIILLSGFNDIPERLLWLVDGYVRKGDSALLLFFSHRVCSGTTLRSRMVTTRPDQGKRNLDYTIVV